MPDESGLPAAGQGGVAEDKASAADAMAPQAEGPVEGAAEAEGPDAGAAEGKEEAAGAALAREAPAQPDDGPRSRPGALTLRFWGASPAGVLIGVLLALLGFGLVVQLQSNTDSGLASRRQDDLVRILDDLSNREDRLRQQINTLQAAQTRLTAGGDSSKAALEEARQRVADLGILAGTWPAQGPGIRITVTDQKGGFTADDMLDVVEELRGAGAETIQVGPARIGLSSAFTQDAPGSPIMVDGVRLSQPYVILAIGDPETLATAMNIPGGVVDTARARGARPQVSQLDRVEIRALRAPKPPQYAQPVPSPGN